MKKISEIGDLQLDKANANRGTQRGRAMVEASLREAGAGRSILADRDGRVIAGNKTLGAATEIGLKVRVVETDGTELVVVQRTDLDLSDRAGAARKLAYYDNQSSAVGLEWDTEQLLADVTAGVDLSAMFQEEELDELLAGLREEQPLEDPGENAPTLAERFIVPPFSVLDARQGYWQDRKRAWLSLGIQSELGRGYTDETLGAIAVNEAADLKHGTYRSRAKANATPGGSLLPAATLGKDGKTERGDGKGRRIGGRLPAAIGGQPLPLDRMANGKSPARTFGQDLMRGEHTVGENRLTWVAGTRDRDSLDDTSRKILAAGRKYNARPPHGASVTQNPDGTLNYKPTENGENTSGTSIFDPVLCECAYTWFCPPDGAILDPFAGGSVRGIVAAYLGRKYTGVDLRAEQIEANKVQGAEIVPDNLPVWIAGNSLSDLPDQPVDFVFSCPPYYDLEVYSEQPGDLSNIGTYEEFIADYRKIVAAAVSRLRDDRFACFVVGDIRGKDGFYRNFVADTIAAFQDAGATLYNEAVLVTAVGSLPIRAGKQFDSGRKLGKTHQNVLVFCKGDWRKATEACGPVDVVDLAEMYGEVAD